MMSVNIHKFEYWKFVMARNKEEHDEFIDKVEEHSLWRQENKPKYGEQMLMLPTNPNTIPSLFLSSPNFKSEFCNPEFKNVAPKKYIIIAK